MSLEAENGKKRTRESTTEEPVKKRIGFSPIYKLNENHKPIGRFFNELGYNTSRAAVNILSDNPNEINGRLLCKLQLIEAMDLLSKYPDKIDGYELSLNPLPEAMDLLSKYPEKINWDNLLTNPSPKAVDLVLNEINKTISKIDDLDFLSANTNSKAIAFLRNNPTKINWMILSKNPSSDAISLLCKNRDKIDWEELATNSSAEAMTLLCTYPSWFYDDWVLRELNKNPSPYVIPLLRELVDINRDKIEWDFLSKNTSSEAISLLRENSKEIDWIFLSENPSNDAVALLRKNPEKINWNLLSGNPSAIALLRENLDKINWINLSKNPSYEAINLLREYPDKIYWNFLYSNPYGYPLYTNLDKRSMKQGIYYFKEESIKNFLNPVILIEKGQRYLPEGKSDDDYLIAMKEIYFPQSF